MQTLATICNRALPWTERAGAAIDSSVVKFIAGSALGGSVFGLLVPTAFDSFHCDMSNFQMGSPASIAFLVTVPTALLLYSGTDGVKCVKQGMGYVYHGLKAAYYKCV